MFVVELQFDGNPERLALRPAHRDRLVRLRDEGVVRMAGPFPDDTGAFLIFDVPILDDLQRVLDDDPYYRAPGVTIVRRQEWTPIVA